MGIVKTLSMGQSGVILDPHRFTDLPPDALANAQNAEYDPTSGHLGALRKRPGWAIFNAVNAGGAIMGGIPMPVAETGGAPADGGGAIVGTGGPPGVNDPGPGDGTGNPGATFDNNPRGVPDPGATSWNPPFATERVVVIGRQGTDGVANGGGAGWYLTSKNFTQNTTSKATPGPFVGPYSFPPATPFADAWGTPSCVLDGKLYYAAGKGSQLTTGAQAIHVNNGATDYALCTIPVSTRDEAFVNYPTLTGAKRQAVVCMHAGSDGNIYIGVKDKFYGQSTNGNAGRVFKLEPTTGTLTDLTASASLTQIPYTVAYFDGHVFWGDFINQSAVNQTPVVWATSSDFSFYTADRSFSSTDASMVSCMCVWKGALVTGVGCYQTGSGVEDGSFLGKLHFRFAGGSLGDTANWNGFSWDTSRTGRGVNGNFATSMVVFNGDLYVAWYAPGSTAYIYRMTQATDTITLANFAVVDTKVFNNTTLFPFTLFVDDGVMYAIGMKSGTTASRIYSTTDGTNWTDGTSKIQNDGFTSYVLPALFGVNQ